ncbi:trypsin-like serine peptidase [Streptomyces sp. NPDC005151]
MPLPLMRRVRRACVVAAAAAAITVTGITAPASADDKPAESSAEATSVAARKTVKDVGAYWTPERMKAAKELTVPAAPTARQPSERGAASEPLDGGVLAEADAMPPKGMTPPTASTAGDLGIQAAEVSVSQQVPGSTITWPLNVVGKLFVTMPDGSQGQCSASVIVSNTKSALWTAAHCIHDGMSNAAGFYSNVLFVPAYRNGAEPWGRWEAANLIVPTSFADGDIDKMLDADMGSVILKPLAPYGNIQDAMGGYGYRFGFDTDYNGVYTFGYPTEGYNRPGSDFNNGEYMMYCQGNTEDAVPFFPLDNRLKMDCDMGRGSSGGPFLSGFPQNIKLIGANSHTSGDPRDSDDLFSSEHANHAIAVINAVNGV